MLRLRPPSTRGPTRHVNWTMAAAVRHQTRDAATSLNLRWGFEIGMVESGVGGGELLHSFPPRQTFVRLINRCCISFTSFIQKALTLTQEVRQRPNVESRCKETMTTCLTCALNSVVCSGCPRDLDLVGIHPCCSLSTHCQEK